MISEKMKRLAENNSVIRAMFEEGQQMAREFGAENVYDFSLGNPSVPAPHAVNQAERFGHTLQREIAFLTVHSMLHLLGYDHEKGGIESVRMREKEETVLTQLGLPRSGSYYMGDE